jgi:hypothetical protein
MVKNDFRIIGTGDTLPKGNTETGDLQGLFGLGPKYPFQEKDKIEKNLSSFR